jgi:hypothetical protein
VSATTGAEYPLDDGFHETSVMELNWMADSLFCDWQNKEWDHGRVAASNRIDDD